MYLFFDTETTGLPKNYRAAVSNVENWPRVIQLAWALYGPDKRLLDQRVDLIKPNGWKIPDGNFWIENGFNQSESEKHGITIRQALLQFLKQIEKTEYLIAHNMSFDRPILAAECIRERLKSKNRPTDICTKTSSTSFCQLPGQYGYKWPTLSELHLKLFDKDFVGGHDALIDVRACADCFFELVQRNIITPEKGLSR
jgi:DNA polymerase-3 subunit epsilon